ncbi:MAG: SpoIID/LytB domain-containing protein [Bacteroides sp.]|nr:SpoIID/LytB domain-containing protein [Bacteroides sp.]
MEEPKVHVGIMFEPQIDFILLANYLCNGAEVTGKQTVSCQEGKVCWNGTLFEELFFEPRQATDSFELQDVTIGINFHWERKENQRFLGALKFIVENDKLTAINILPVEEYLTSVISSEMSATASLELLKAHAVISRSWLLAQIQKNKELTEEKTEYSTCHQSEDELIRWYDREDHTRFDVCADDHCQRYQGITRASTEIVKQAIAATRGQILTSEGKICDARFSKCCGGAYEEFQYCWEDKKYPYLSKQRDSKTCTNLPDLTQEAEADKWIRTSPEAFCNTTDKKILSQVLNNYDQETTDFYRWKVEYTQEELSALILKRSGIDYGQIIDLIPVARGTSGRLWKLKIVGTKKSMTIGKELEIRRTLSPSHLYSSAFVVDKENISADGIPGRFILTGAGWGHGAGLCQIGAAVMGEQGYPYKEILLHYFINASIDKLY